ncbi:MAG TPA: right-handed parallel beta-helix repeat-containing protein, partial [Longimicrobium sp.]
MTSSISVPRGGPALTRSTAALSISSPGYDAVCGTRATAAIQKAVNASQDVVIPACDFYVDTTITLPSYSRVRGAGDASRLIVSRGLANDGKSMFFTTGSSDVTVERLRFRGASKATHYAFHARFANGRIRFLDNVVERMGLMLVDNSSDVEVLRNTGSDVILALHDGVHITYASSNVRVRRNSISDYSSGVIWWGGEADPERGGFGRSYGPQHVVIDSNTVRNTTSGIFGGRGAYIKVRHNDVQNCEDVCLDAEGSHDVYFGGNTAKYAGQAVLASFFYSSKIVFENNYVEQDGTQHGPKPAAAGLRAPWQQMFALFSRWEDPDSTSTILRGNRFVYHPLGEGVGRVYKESSKSMWMDRNILTNTVVEMGYNNSGVVDLTGNKLHFNFTAPYPAVHVGSNHFPWGAS